MMIAAQSDRRVQRHIGSGEGNSSPHGTYTGDKHDENDVVCDEDGVYDGQNTVVIFNGALLNQFCCIQSHWTPGTLGVKNWSLKLLRGMYAIIYCFTSERINP